MNFLNAVAEATITDSAALASPGNGGSISMTEALGLSVTGIVVVMIILALLAILVVILSKVVRTFEKASKGKKSVTKEKAENTAAKLSLKENKQEIKAAALEETQSLGQLELYKTDEKTAAVIMAIVSKESGIALNKLQFNSIKLIEK